MSEQRNRLDEYDTPLAEVTQIIREQVRLIENNPSACIEYKRRINWERWLFADAWNCHYRNHGPQLSARGRYQASSTTPPDNNAGMTILGSRRRRQIIQAGYQASAKPPNNAGTTTTGRQQAQAPRRRQITLFPFEAPEIWRSCSDNFRHFFFSLPYLSRHNLGEEEKECNICYYPYFASRGNLEAGAIRNGTVPRLDKGLKPHEVPLSDLPELPVRLPCGHVFGQMCVLKWISLAGAGGSGNHPKCPICRAIWTPLGLSNTPPGHVTIEV